MSGIYIPGLDALKCDECFWCIGYRIKCNAGSKDVLLGSRREDCPLIHVQDHGRLIEEHDAVLAFYSVYQEHGLPWYNAEVILEKCKTILPSG